MTEGAHHRLANSRQHFAESRLAVKVSAQNQRVDESANQILGLKHRPAGDRRTNNDVFLAAVTKQQSLKRCQQRHEQGGILVSTQEFERRGEVRRHLRRHAAPLKAVHWRPRKIGWQIHHCRCIGKLTLPVIELPVNRLAFQPTPLPKGKV